MNQLDIFYNTTSATGGQLQSLKEKNLCQNEKILAFFKSKPFQSFAPSKVHFLLFDTTTPITSIRRGINTLTNAGHLLKTGHKVLGPMGANEYTWKLNTK